MALLQPQQVVPTGLNPGMQAATAGGDKVLPSATTWLRVTNAGAGSVTVTVETAAPSTLEDRPNVVVVVPADGSRMIGPLSEPRFSGSVDGLASVTYSGVTSVTVGAFYITSVDWSIPPVPEDAILLENGLPLLLEDDRFLLVDA
ncbi:MAG: hypothetical protein LC798_16705 [Chloroflexi bacterium]|nr:hypothetical protein [Chloroflexota bacterium]